MALHTSIFDTLTWFMDGKCSHNKRCPSKNSTYPARSRPAGWCHRTCLWF